MIELFINDPIMQGLISSFIFKAAEVTALKVGQSNFYKEFRLCIESSVDSISEKYPIFKPLNGRTFWDSVAEEIIDNIKHQPDYSSIKVNYIFQSVLKKFIEGEYELKELEQINNDFLAILEFKLASNKIVYPHLLIEYQKLIQTSLFNIEKIASKVLETVKEAEVDEIKEQLFGYIISSQQWAIKELGTEFFERDYITINPTINLEKDIQQTIDFLELSKVHSNVLILGEPGCGKTHSLKQILLTYTKNQNELDSIKIPIYLRLATYGNSYQSILDGIYNTLIDFIPKINKDNIRELLIKGSFILVLDGLDEVKEDYYEKCIENINNIIDHFDNNRVIVTSRDNVYSNEFGDKVVKYKIMTLSQKQITQLLERHCKLLPHQIKRELLELFGNPLLLKIGIRVIQNNGGKIPLNRSILFNEFIDYLILKWDKEKGLLRKSNISYIEILDLLCLIAFEFFEENNITKEQIYRYLEKVFPSKDLDSIYEYVINIGILDVNLNSEIEFEHRTYKEYFAAKYIVNEFELSGNYQIINDFINKKQWYEVFIFATGLFKNWELQNLFLDIVLDNNLKLYVDCLQSKNDFTKHFMSKNGQEYALQYMDSLVSSYEKIINKYFLQIKNLFYPNRGYKDNIDNTQICIMGNISENKESLLFILKVGKLNESKVTFKTNIDWEEEKKLHLKSSYTMQTNHINLKLSDLMGDSARQVALKQIKSELNKIIQEERLNESTILLCEKMNHLVKKVDKKNTLDTTKSVYEWTENQIKNKTEYVRKLTGSEFLTIDFGELSSLMKVVSQLCKMKVEYHNYLLPEKDNKKPAYGWIWHWYTKERLIERVYYFFKYLTESFIEMVETNFNEIKNYMPDYVHFPYKYVVTIYFPNVDPKEYHSEPSIEYYYFPTENTNECEPEITIMDYDERERDLTSLDEKLHNAFKNKDRYTGNYSIHSGSIGFILNTYRKSSEMVLHERTYDLIKNNLEKIFGKF